jgi:hypothetical protein
MLANDFRRVSEDIGHLSETGTVTEQLRCHC